MWLLTCQQLLLKMCYNGAWIEYLKKQPSRIHLKAILQDTDHVIIVQTRVSLLSAVEFGPEMPDHV